MFLVNYVQTTIEMDKSLIKFTLKIMTNEKIKIKKLKIEGKQLDPFWDKKSKQEKNSMFFSSSTFENIFPKDSFEFSIPCLYLWNLNFLTKRTFFHAVSNLENKVNKIAYIVWLSSQGTRQMKNEKF